VFHAGRMPSCAPEAAQYYAVHIAGPTRLVHFRENSHALISENPDRFLAELTAFFETE